MTNNEYNKEVLRILQELRNTATSKIYPESSPIDVVEIFVMCLRDVLVNYVNKRPTSQEIMKEFRAILGDIRFYVTHIDKFKTCNKLGNQENLDFEYLYTNSVELLDKLEKYFAPLRETFFIVSLQYGMMHLPDIERFLYQMKVKSPSELINRIVELQDFEEKTLHDEKAIWEKQYAFGGDKLNFLIILSIYYFFRNVILDAILRVDYRRIPPFLIFAEYFGKNYSSTFRERIEQYSLYLNNWDEFWETHRVSSMQLQKNILERMKKDNNDYTNIFSFLASALSKIGYSKFILDLHWFIYYVCYCHTPDFIDFCFSLLDSELPLRFQEAFLQTVKKSVVAPIVQYEYEWYCRKHDQDPQFQFYEGDPIDWKKSNIANYDLDKWVSPLLKNKTLPKNDNNKELISVSIESSNELIPLSLPFIFEGLRRSEQLVALRILHELTNNYQESNENDFCYLLGRTPEKYDKTNCKKIDWKKGKPELQYFIIKLYKKNIMRRGTWDKADNIFRIAGIEKLKLKENTTANIENLSGETKKDIDEIIENALKYIKEKHP